GVRQGGSPAPFEGNSGGEGGIAHGVQTQLEPRIVAGAPLECRGDAAFGGMGVGVAVMGGEPVRWQADNGIERIDVAGEYVAIAGEALKGGEVLAVQSLDLLQEQAGVALERFCTSAQAQVGLGTDALQTLLHVAHSISPALPAATFAAWTHDS